MPELILVLSYAILIYFAALSAGYSFLLLASLRDILQQFKEAEIGNIVDLIKSDNNAPLVTIVVPVYNEKRRVLDTVYSINNNDHQPINIILVNDESTDNTMEILKEELQLYEVPPVIKQTIKTRTVRKVYASALYKNITVIDKLHGHGSGADSVNVGLNACTTPLYMTVDADTILEPEAVSRLLFTFFSQPHCITVGGAVYVLNEIPVVGGRIGKIAIPSPHVPAFQSIEYVRSFLFGRAGWNLFNGALCYAGAFTLFEKQAVLDIGGYDSKNFAYDAEIVTHLHEYMRDKNFPYTAYFTSNAFSWTIVPGTVTSYWKQRNKWQRGMLRTFFMHKHMFLNPRYGVVGMFNVPFNFFFEILGPVVEFISYFMAIIAYVFNPLALEPLIWSLVLAAGFAAFLNLANFVLNIITYKRYNSLYDTLKVIYLVIIEMFGFRQIRAATCFVATCQYFWNRLRGSYH